MNRRDVIAQNASLILRGIYEYNIASRLRALPAREWLFPVTYRCDARCVMCNIWQSDKSGELSLEDWRGILANRLFAGVQSVSLTGGEPTLRHDLPELAELLMQKLPALRRLTVTTNALATERVVRQCTSLLDLCAAHSVRFFVGISLDGVGAVHDEMRGIPGAFDKVQQTVQELQSLRSRGLRMGVNCTLTNRNLHQAGSLRRWSSERGLSVNWIVASFADSYYANTASEDNLAITGEQREDLIAFLQTLGTHKTPGNLAAYFHADAAGMLERGKARTTPCVFQKDGFMLDARGDLQYCMYSRVLGNAKQQNAADVYFAVENLAHRQELIANQCHNCTITCFLELALAKDAFRYARFLLGGQP
jgi:MoaA/NifB/PqqE/SkfB family radical SAM enzyme